jgi:hypothetical protein
VPAWHRLIGAVGLLGHLGLLVFYAGSGLVAPGWAVIVLMIVWLALLVLGIRLLITRPLLALLVPVVAALFWYAAISAGDAFLNWTA